MIKKDDFTARIMEIDIFDTHSHLTGDRLGARDFWEIGEYFWFLEELLPAGIRAASSIFQTAGRKKDNTEKERLKHTSRHLTLRGTPA